MVLSGLAYGYRLTERDDWRVAIQRRDEWHVVTNTNLPHFDTEACLT
jgi:hypothetical protein